MKKKLQYMIDLDGPFSGGRCFAPVPDAKRFESRLVKGRLIRSRLGYTPKEFCAVCAGKGKPCPMETIVEAEWLK
jgi:hypothetical protein